MSVPLEASHKLVLPDETQSTQSIALYIGRMSAELGRLAQRHHLEPLAYILEMARLEAEQTARASAEAAAAARAGHK